MEIISLSQKDMNEINAKYPIPEPPGRREIIGGKSYIVPDTTDPGWRALRDKRTEERTWAMLAKSLVLPFPEEDLDARIEFLKQLDLPCGILLKLLSEIMKISNVELERVETLRTEFF
jgi:hypothetical protein